MNRRVQASQRGSAERIARILILPGDGIGPEVAEQGVRALEAAAKSANIELASIGCAAMGDLVPERLGKG